MYRLTSSLCAVAAILAGSTAAPTARELGNNLLITNLELDYAESGNTSIRFNIQDEATVANYTASCTATFASRPTPTGEAFACSTQAFQASIDGWNSYDDFRLHFSHSYKDPAIGPPGMDYVTVFANADIADPDQIDCEDGESSTQCLEPTGTVIKAPITSAIAKK
ncbi:hypothetical protein AMS68_001800 [Peltaster fructicola]|uniref:AA1-like domain-containing protein n=1 Tax=Peltaster fructicola TaxID=286661 RepID=A0A6H0XNJ0_9PEZI|nr:hypothetical protein AMS68_001800 [Peltaster fructicola]